MQEADTEGVQVQWQPGQLSEKLSINKQKRTFVKGCRHTWNMYETLGSIPSTVEVQKETRRLKH
jgi:hypothetical protein